MFTNVPICTKEAMKLCYIGLSRALSLTLGLPFSVQIGVKVNGRKIVGDKKLKLKFMILLFAESLI